MKVVSMFVGLAIFAAAPVFAEGENAAPKVSAPQTAAEKDAAYTAQIKAAAAPAELTDAQIKAVKAAVPSATSREDYGKLKQAIADQLTPAQQAQVTKGLALKRVGWKYAAAKLTEDQLKTLSDTADKLVKDSSLSVGDVTDKLIEKAESLLTPEQKKAMTPPANPGGPQGPSIQKKNPG
jgi:hypothetical protein